MTTIQILGRVSTQTEYDRRSRDTFRVEDDGDTSRSFYDGADRIIRGIDAESNRVAIVYDDNHNVIETRETDLSQVEGVVEEVFLTTSFYDSLNRPQRRIDNLGQTDDYRYDSRNNLVAMADASGPPGPVIERRSFANGALTSNTSQPLWKRDPLLLRWDQPSDRVGADSYGFRTGRRHPCRSRSPWCQGGHADSRPRPRVAAMEG